MRNLTLSGLACVLLAVLSTPIKSFGQLSVSINYGFVSNSDGDDRWALNTVWPPCSTCGTGGSNNNSGDNNNSLVFYSRASGTSLLVTAAYDVSPIFSVGLVYRNLTYNESANKRSGSTTSYGIQPRLNFIKNTSRVVPFFQGEFYFSNSSSVSQKAATSTQYPTQIQPGFSSTSSSNLGVGGDLGVEITLIPALHLVLSGGFHGVEVGDSSLDALVKNLNYPAAFDKPQAFDGTFFTQYAAGLKYYFGKSKKKRDF